MSKTYCKYCGRAVGPDLKCSCGETRVDPMSSELFASVEAVLDSCMDGKVSNPSRFKAAIVRMNEAYGQIVIRGKKP